VEGHSEKKEECIRTRISRTIGEIDWTARFSSASGRNLYNNRTYIIRRVEGNQGVGANNATVAQVAMQAPSPVLHAKIAGGAPTIVTPKTHPAAA
jgi:hypothetical protein